MRKFAIFLLLLAIAAGLLSMQLSRWREGTQRQLQTVERQAQTLAAFARQESALWTNDKAEKALSYRPKIEEQEAYAQFRSPEDILFLSESEAWDEEKLELLYEELLRNRHGEELNTLEQVTVLAEEDEFAAATHRNTVQPVALAVRFPLFSKDAIVSLRQYGGQITLYGGDRKTTVLEMAGELSHEYGHHYTLTYMLPGDGSFMDLQRDYAKLRGLDPETTLTARDDAELYYENHKDYLVEIAAEDYVVLMGSPNAMADQGDYIDIRDFKNGKTGDQWILRNAAPQENMFLPFAADVPGLADYFYGFLDEPAPEFPDASGAEPRFERHAVGYDLVGGYRTFVSYRVTWDKVLGEDATYTLICLDPQTETLQPIKTVRAGEEAKAEIGELAVESGSRINYYEDGVTKGTKRFLVVVITPDGRAAVSDAVEKRF